MSVSCQEIAFVDKLGHDGRAIVTVRRAEACHSCAAQGACNALGGKTQDMTLAVDNDIGARPGDQVVLSLSEASVIKASAVLYLVPAICVIGGAIAGSIHATDLGLDSDLAAIIGSGIGLAAGLGLTAILGARMSKDKQYLPKLVSIKSRASS